MNDQTRVVLHLPQTSPAKRAQQSLRLPLISASLIASAWASNVAFAADIAAGRALFQMNCSNSSCHGADPLRNINGVQKAANKSSEISNAISTNKGGMSQFRNAFSQTDLDNIAAYIATPSGTNAPTPAPTPAPTTTPTPAPTPAPTSTPAPSPTAPPAPGSGPLSVNISSLNLGTSSVGMIGAYKVVTVTNTSAAAVSITGLGTSSSDFVTLDDCPLSLPAKAACNISVQIAPRAAGSLAGTLSVSTSTGAVLLSVPLSGTGTPAQAITTPADTVVEYYNPDLEHYFITAGAGEQGFIDSGSVGRWLRTGVTFKSGGPAQVCRFYGNGAKNPATGNQYGPNSHFYTADSGECDTLKRQFSASAKSWSFESLDFRTTASIGGACPAALVPIYRAYNNGFAKGEDSNHRITSDLAAYQQLLTLGWNGEGIVMCAPK
jgi:mono/diheme cytochrome c family protein